MMSLEWCTAVTGDKGVKRTWFTIQLEEKKATKKKEKRKTSTILDLQRARRPWWRSWRWPWRPWRWRRRLWRCRWCSAVGVRCSVTARTENAVDGTSASIRIVSKSIANEHVVAETSLGGACCSAPSTRVPSLALCTSV